MLILLSVIALLIAGWCSFMIPKGAHDRPLWMSPKRKLQFIVGFLTLVAVGSAWLEDDLLLIVIALALPLIAYFASEGQEVDKLMKKTDKKNPPSRKICRGIVRQRD